MIVTLNGRKLVEDCLATIEAQTRFPDETIVVDNGSTDGTAEVVAERFPWVTVVRSPTNLGFAGGNNLGINSSTGEIIVLLNNDTLAAPGFIDAIAAPIECDPRVGSVAGTMVFATDPERVASAGIEVYQNGLALDRRIGAPWESLPRVDDVFGPSAGAGAYRRTALEEVGLLAESYFLYLEDVDLAWRLRLAGWRSIAARDAHVRHIYSASEGRGPSAKDFFMARNRAWSLVRCWPAAAWRRHWWRVTVYELGALIYGVATRNVPSLQGRIAGWAALRQVLRERAGVQRGAVDDANRLVYWLQPSPGSREHLRIRREIRRYARNRPPT